MAAAASCNVTERHPPMPMPCNKEAVGAVQAKTDNQTPQASWLLRPLPLLGMGTFLAALAFQLKGRQQREAARLKRQTRQVLRTYLKSGGTVEQLIHGMGSSPESLLLDVLDGKWTS